MGAGAGGRRSTELDAPDAVWRYRGLPAMCSTFPPDDAPTIASNPLRSLWEAALVGHGEALAQVLERSAPAVYAWLRADGAEPAEAVQRTGDFLARLQTVDRPDPQEEDVARLQDFLQRRLTAHAAAGFPEPAAGASSRQPVFDQAQAERRFLREAARTQEDVFTRRWALGTLELTIELLVAEFSKESKGALVPHLRQFLSFTGSEERYAQIAEQTGTSVSALRVTVYRFRQRYREILRRLVGDTVRNPEDVDTELTKLLVSAS